MNEETLRREERHGHFDYDAHGHSYCEHRETDPFIAEIIERELGECRTVLNVGAGTGSYEPEDRYVIAVEPSLVMREVFS